MKSKSMQWLVAMVLVTAAVAAPVKLAWDPSTTEGVTYRIYAHQGEFPVTNLTAALVKIDVGTNLTATIEDLQSGVWTFAATALKAGLESDLSNLLVVEVPGAPGNMRTVVLQFSGTITNFHDVGFFKLRLD